MSFFSKFPALLPLLILLLILTALAAPPAVKKKSWAWFFGAFVLSFFVVLLPLFMFFISEFGTPEWKGGCAYGWLDCFYSGKLALAPLVLWATAALYAVEVLQVSKRTKKWIVLGIFSGAIISVVCLVFALVCLHAHLPTGPTSFSMAGPLYVAIWYTWRATRLGHESGWGVKAFLGTLLGTIPFWISSILWSKSIYASLPDSPPTGCFIVTAAGRGHKKLVGPFRNIQRHGPLIQANDQLITFWAFENLWQNYAPHSHACFRRFYNRWGPVVARQIRSPLVADVIYVALKPVEFAAKLAIQIFGIKQIFKK